MARATIDRNKVRAHLIELDSSAILAFLYRAIDLVPESRLPALIEGYIRADTVRPDGSSPDRLIEAARTFERASLEGQFYEDFRVDSHNYIKNSRGTDRWIAEFQRMLDLAVAEGTTNAEGDAREVFEILFGLLRGLDEDPDRIIFFADDAGSWQVGVDWDRVLPAYLGCVSRSASPDEYARIANELIESRIGFMQEHHAGVALEVANPAQRKALQGGRGPH